MMAAGGNLVYPARLLAELPPGLLRRPIQGRVLLAETFGDAGVGSAANGRFEAN
jgi:hypothetical protein